MLVHAREPEVRQALPRDKHGIECSERLSERHVLPESPLAPSRYVEIMDAVCIRVAYIIRGKLEVRSCRGSTAKDALASKVHHHHHALEALPYKFSASIGKNCPGCTELFRTIVVSALLRVGNTLQHATAEAADRANDLSTCRHLIHAA